MQRGAKSSIFLIMSIDHEALVAGCNHEFCTRCALYLCSTYSTSTIVAGPPGSIPCPLCRHAIVSFFKLSGTSPVRGLPRTSLSLSLCTTCPSVGSDSTTLMTTQLCKPDFHCTQIPPLGSSSFRSFSCQWFPSMKLTDSLRGSSRNKPVPCKLLKSRIIMAVSFTRGEQQKIMALCQ